MSHKNSLSSLQSLHIDWSSKLKNIFIIGERANIEKRCHSLHYADTFLKKKDKLEYRKPSTISPGLYTFVSHFCMDLYMSGLIYGGYTWNEITVKRNFNTDIQTIYHICCLFHIFYHIFINLHGRKYVLPIVEGLYIF